MTQTLLQSQFAHTSLPHTGCVRVPEGVWRHPRFPYAKPLKMSLKQFDQGMIAQRLQASLALTSHQKHQRTLSLSRAFLHDVSADGLQGFWLVQIDNPFTSGFGAYPLWVIVAVTNDHALPSILDIFQVEIEHLTWSKPSLQHE